MKCSKKGFRPGNGFFVVMHDRLSRRRHSCNLPPATLDGLLTLCQPDIMMRANERQNDSTLREEATVWRAATDDDLDVPLLEDSLARTPWERMQANDDALRFADSLRAAMEKRNAKP